MSEPGLNQLEREVQAARAKLATDLSTLRSPATAAEFTETLKLEAMDAKDALLKKAKTSVQSSLESVIEDLKARAAANPAAALAIGAGISWRLIRHPPIATALIGAGLLSLFRTQPPPAHPHAPADYLAQAKSRLVEQAGEAAEFARDKAAAATQSVAGKARETAGKVKERAQDLAAQASTAASDLAADAKEQTASMWSETTDALQRSAGSARETTSGAVSRASAALDQHWQRTQSALPDAEARDKLLLGAAGIAVLAALGFAWQRRAAQQA